MEDLLITALELVGLFAVAAGATAGLYPLIGWWSLVFGGLILLAAAQLASSGLVKPRRR